MIKYNLYLGLNDKDTKQQMITTLDAYNIASNITNKFFEGATFKECLGIFKHEDGTAIKETTLNILIIETEDKSIQVKALIEELKVTFNQECIMLDIEETNGIQFI